MTIQSHKGSADEGFSMVELLVVIAILGILSAIALPTFLHQKDKGYRAMVESDLRMAAATQEVYAAGHAGRYTTSLDDLSTEGFRSSNGVVISVRRAGADGFCLAAEHSGGTRMYYSTDDGAPTETVCA
jgi:type IV pilus assembly protein PilA